MFVGLNQILYNSYMNDLGVNENTVTGQIYISIFEVLHEHLDSGIIESLGE